MTTWEPSVLICVPCTLTVQVRSKEDIQLCRVKKGLRISPDKIVLSFTENELFYPLCTSRLQDSLHGSCPSQ
jgi:hypothetical protein